MRIALLTIGLAVFAASSVSAERSDALVGTWRLVSASSVTDDGQENATPYGRNPRGFITYTRDGRMTAVLSYDGRKPLSGDRESSTVQERAEAFSTAFAYAGRYTFSGDKVTHHVEVSTIENWTGTDLVRSVVIEGNRVKLRTPMRSLGGRMQSTELVWERIGTE